MLSARIARVRSIVRAVDPAVKSVDEALPASVDFKLQAKRHQDIADVVALLEGLDDARYLALEAATPPARRPELARLREDALEELRFED